jgi:hypothetical protein
MSITLVAFPIICFAFVEITPGSRSSIELRRNAECAAMRRYDCFRIEPIILPKHDLSKNTSGLMSGFASPASPEQR